MLPTGLSDVSEKPKFLLWSFQKRQKVPNASHLLKLKRQKVKSSVRLLKLKRQKVKKTSHFPKLKRQKA
jgi:hypothetical protein